MNISVVCFTADGAKLCENLVEKLSLAGHNCMGWVPERFLAAAGDTGRIMAMKTPLGEWTKEQFGSREGLIFIGAAGIAVRAVAPYLRDKTRDPAVVAVDDMGRFSISLLSGHLGGANDLALEAAALLGAQPVITTATDNHGRFAVDNFAKERGLFIADMNLAKKISADILSGEMVGFFSDFPVGEELPAGLKRDVVCRRNIWITVKNRPDAGNEFQRPVRMLRQVLEPESLRPVSEPEFLRLIPGAVVVGIGCRKGIDRDTVETVMDRMMRQWNIAPESVGALATIDIKKAEDGLVGCAGRRGIPLFTYSAEALMEAEGDFTVSEFVRETTGADNVCERAAMVCAEAMGGGKLLVKKQAGSGVTVAAAVRKWKVTI